MMRHGLILLACLALTLPAWAEPSSWDTLSTSAFSAYQDGRYPEAIQAAEEALAVAEAMWPGDHVNVATSCSVLAALYHVQGRTAEAKPLYAKALAIYERVLGHDDPHVAALHASLRALAYPSDDGPNVSVPEEVPDRMPEPARSPRQTWRTRLKPWAEVDTALMLGHRTDNLKWSIAGNVQGFDPNILSELTWSDVESIQLRTTQAWTIRRHFYLRGAGDFAWITAGANQDSDYLRDNRAFEFSRSTNDAGGHLYDASIGGGYRFRFLWDQISIAPLVGYSAHWQDLDIVRGSQVLARFRFNAPLGQFEQLHSTYRAKWEGPWAGVDVAISPVPRVTMSMTFEYHVAAYDGTANWNLRSDFAHPESFAHEADDGHGTLVSLGLAYRLTDQWSVAADFDYQDWFVGTGTDLTYFSDGSTVQTRLNEATWDSWSASIGAQYRF